MARYCDGVESAAEPDGTGAYPPSWETDVVLKDGHTVHVRPIVPGDAERLVSFHHRQSPESIYSRYFSPRPRLSRREVEHLTTVDHRDRVAFIALSGEELVGVARYERYRGTDTAEIAFFVDDDRRGRGLATLLLEYLAEAARDNGLRRFTATTLPNNRRMLKVFSAAGYDVATRLEDGVIEVAFAIGATGAAIAAMDRRERIAEAASVRRMLRPATVAVVGAGRRGEGLGGEVFRNILGNGFTGTAYPVNRAAAAAGDPVFGVPAYASLSDLPEPMDLVVVAVQAADVPDVVDECGRCSAGGVAVLSAGFADEGAEGRLLQHRAVEAARRHGIRLLGPNCLGILNTHESLRLDATMSPYLPASGRVGMLSEAGLLSTAIIDHALRSELGVSTFVAAGNRADIAATDLLSYWMEDEDTEAVLMYLAARPLPPRFVRAARAASLSLPIAALHTSLSGSAGVRGRGQAIGERRAQAVFRQTGVISVSTLSQLFDIGQVLADQPVPAGRGVAVIGNSEGALALAADACVAAGLDLVPLRVDGVAGPIDSNPVDLTHRADAEDYARALGQLASDPSVHSIVVVHTPPRLGLDVDVVDAVLAATDAAPEVTFVATVLGAGDSGRLGTAEGRGVPAFRFPEDAVRALGRLAAYRDWLRTADGFAFEAPVGCDTDRARVVAGNALARRAAHGEELVALDHGEQEALLSAFAVEMVPRRVIDGPGAAIAAADEIGWPIALKAAGRNRRARSAASGVVLDIVDSAQLHAAWERMSSTLGSALLPAVVQEFLDEGLDVAVTVTREPDGSATVEVGLGGPAEFAGERELGVLPLSLADASALVANSAVGRMLTDPLDRVRIVEVVHRLAALAEEVESVRRIYADPVVVAGLRAQVADVEVLVGDVEEEFTVRRLE
jgi:acyl-CoA synthetase (NDP forming)/RimJ/RimL family protein N-acetyltransferase